MGESTLITVLSLLGCAGWIVVALILNRRILELEHQVRDMERVTLILARGFNAAHATEQFDADMQEANALMDYGATDEAIEILERWKHHP